ncbi:MAG: nuclease (SNase) [Sideroxydans sp. GWF2_59_14]|nr:MAG: nuclease (SNase) [Sideroxydans sp. GWF2_59_14]HAF44136.1 nuclease (SNase) [Gallionellaceae bacterium]
MRLPVALACCFALVAQAEVFTAGVVGVLDGDTILVRHEGKTAKVRLANIDAPEKAQPFGKQARLSLRELVYKKQVQIDGRAVDQYGRIVALVSAEGLDVNREQLKRGMAWEYSYRHSDKSYIALQSEAQQAQRGLWAAPDPQAPWQWRRQHPWKKPSVQQKSFSELREVPVMLYDMECGKKRRCSEMTSCDEARFYLVRCGVMTLDGDRDGEPCKALCAGQ